MGSVVASIVGADKSDGIGDATHAVTLSAFYLAKTETTYADWIAVRTWARDAARDREGDFFELFDWWR